MTSQNVLHATLKAHMEAPSQPEVTEEINYETELDTKNIEIIQENFLTDPLAASSASQEESYVVVKQEQDLDAFEDENDFFNDDGGNSDYFDTGEPTSAEPEANTSTAAAETSE